MSININALDAMDSVLWSRAGDSAQFFSYAPYGNTPERGGNSLLPGFNGERLDPVSLTYHLGNGYRAYTPALMRFNTPDAWSPYGAGGLNPYSYCEGDPINRSDPSGHVSRMAGMGIGLGIVGLLGAIFSAGMSIATAGGIMAALSAASAVDLVTAGAGVVSDVASIACGASASEDPEASSVLGVISFGLGLIGTIDSLAHIAKGIRTSAKTTNLLREQILDAFRPGGAPRPKGEGTPHPSAIRRLSEDGSLSGMDFGYRVVDREAQRTGNFHYRNNDERRVCEWEVGVNGRIQYKHDGSAPADGRYNFIYSVDRRLFGFDTTFNHSTIMQGTAVRSAGWLNIDHGRIVKITNASGHYKPAPDKFFAATKDMAKRGFILPSVEIETRTPRQFYDAANLFSLPSHLA